MHLKSKVTILFLWLHTVSPRGDIMTGTREAKLSAAFVVVSSGLPFSGIMDCSASCSYLKCNLCRIVVGRCLVSGFLHPGSWFVKAVVTGSRSSGLFLSELWFWPHSMYFFWNGNMRKGAQWLRMPSCPLGGSGGSLPWSWLPGHLSGTKRMVPLAFPLRRAVLGGRSGGILEKGVEEGGILTLSSVARHTCLLSLKNSMFFILSLCTYKHFNPDLPRHEKNRKVWNEQRITWKILFNLQDYCLKKIYVLFLF